MIAAVALFARIRAAGAPSILEIVWAPMTTGPSITFGLLADGISASMAVLVAFVVLLVQVYSLSYMSEEKPAAWVAGAARSRRNWGLP